MSKKLRLLFIISLLIVFSVSAFMLIRGYAVAMKEQKANTALSETFHSAKETKQIASASDILPEFQELYKQNSDIAGWLTIKGCSIDYPVMYTENDQNYYLHKAFDKTGAVSGTLFLGVPYSGKTNHAIIYGHHMKNGSMFGKLNRYADENFGKENSVIQFDTLCEHCEYELVGVFYSKVYSKDDTNNFKYYNFADLSSQDDFEEYVRNVKSLSLYETGVAPKWGDTLLTLSTCEYHTENGRFAVLFRRIEK